MSAKVFDGDAKRITFILARLLQLLPLNLSSISDVEAELAGQAQEG